VPFYVVTITGANSGDLLTRTVHQSYLPAMLSELFAAGYTLISVTRKCE
jgi:hypothetical protein